MENWTITPFGLYSTEARRVFGPYTVIAVASPTGGSWRIDVGGIEIARSTAPLGAKTIEMAIERATAQISALVDALAPFSALAAEAAHAEEVIASTRALLEESKAAYSRQEARLNRYVRRAEMCAWGPEDADEEGGQ
jgi:hypothetical protein